MDQRSDHIRQDIEETRAALDEKLDTLETKARQTFDLNHQMSERPWVMLGAAVAAGYVLGSMGGDHSPRRTTELSASGPSPQGAQTVPHFTHTPQAQAADRAKPAGDGILSQFDDEIEMLKTAAVATLTNFLRDSIRAYVPALGHQLDAQTGSRTPSSAPNASMSTGAGASANYEGIPETTSYGSNTVSRQSAQGEPYYPPGANTSPSRPDYVQPGDAGRARSVGDEPVRF